MPASRALRARVQKPLGRMPPGDSRAAPVSQPRLFEFRISIELPSDSLGGDFSRAHPEIRYEIRNRMTVAGGRLLLEIAARGPGAGTYVEQVRRTRGVKTVQVYRETAESAVFRIVQLIPVVDRVIAKHRILTKYPILLESGTLRFETVAEAAQVRGLLRELRKRVGPSRVEAVRRGSFSPRTLNLTPAQDRVFREALAQGFFSVPRGISVTELAARLGRSKSTVSVDLSNIRRRFIDTVMKVDPSFSQ